MDKASTDISIARLSYSDIKSQAAKWYLTAALAFLVVVLLHQFLLGAISYDLGYETHIHISRVDSLPHTSIAWSTDTVAALYIFPCILLLLASFIVLMKLFYGDQAVTVKRWFLFWFMVFSVLMASALMSISFLYKLDATESLFQGFAVFVSWIGSGLMAPLLIFLVSSSINLLFGFYSARILFNLMPILIRKRGKPARVKVMAAFFYPVFALFLFAMLLTFPKYHYFFVVMFMHTALWFPGLFFINPTTLPRSNLKMAVSKNYDLYILVTVVTLIAILIQVFLT